MRTDANGVPYIDFTAPLLATYHAPIALPPAYAFPSGDVHFSVSQTPVPFAVVPPGQRYGKVPRYSGYVVGRSLYLLGDEADWAGVRNLQIHFVPAPEDPTDEDEVLLVDATAQDVLASVVALLLAERLEGTDQMPDKVLASLRQRAETDQQLWLARVVAGGSAISASYISDPLP